MALTDGPSVVIPFDAHRRVVDWNQSGFQVGGLPFGQIQIAQRTAEIGLVRHGRVDFIRTPETGIRFQVLDLVQGGLILRFRDEIGARRDVNVQRGPTAAQLVGRLDRVLAGIFRIDAQYVQGCETEIVDRAEAMPSRQSLSIVEPFDLRGKCRLRNLPGKR